jgi:hypothetical protein
MKWLWSYLRHCSGNVLEGLRKITKHIGLSVLKAEIFAESNIWS